MGLFSVVVHVYNEGPWIVSERHLESFPPDYVLVLAWNIMEDMKAKVASYSPSSKLICPIPTPSILG